MDQNHISVDLEHGDIVQVAGWPFEMVVIDCNLTAPGYGFYMHEGIYNPVLCGWKDDDGEHEEWFDPSTVKLVRRASA